ncbi:MULTISPECIES: hypothetical protein [unclassified Plantibacter]|uniref:hypothetical protein n=1 Tax=unclassified Plantibacter TaxID=2624265 RepID=UPI003D327FEA
MGFREWDEVAWLDRLNDWLRAHRAVYVVSVTIVALVVFGVDFSSTPAAVRSALMLAVLVAALVVAVTQLVRGSHRSDRSRDEPS